MNSTRRIDPLPWPLRKIIDTAIELQASGRTGASTGEQIAAAFVLNRQDCLPDTERDLVKAWECLGHTWQAHVRSIKRDYWHLLDAGWPT